MAFPVIDAHQHVWDLSRARYDWLTDDVPTLKRTIEMDEVIPELDAAGIDLTILVQSADNAEDTATMIHAADAHPRVAGIVGWVPLDRPDEVAATLERWSSDDRMVGVRNLIHDLPDPDWLLTPAADEGLGVLEAADVPFDLVAVQPRHLELIPIISERHPGLRIVIDHLSKPPIGLPESDSWAATWRELMGAAAENPRVYGKYSGLYSATADTASWTTEQIRPFTDFVVERFGADRLMYGGDWPVSNLAGGYTRVWQGLAPLLDVLSAPEREAILGRTAASFYRIAPRFIEATG